MISARRGALYVVTLLAALATLQLIGHVDQWRHGFRPFVTPPDRVVFSWDMFAPAIGRCDVTWSPPLAIDGRRVATTNDRAPAIEWESVDDELDEASEMAKAACFYKAAPGTVARVHCALPEGTVAEVDVACP